MIPTPSFPHHLKVFGAKFKSASNGAALCAQYIYIVENATGRRFFKNSVS